MSERREAVAINSRDGVVLEGELAVAQPNGRAAALLCHPHPRYGGSMRSFVIGDLFRALPDAGVTCLRFNFRGVEGSEGEWDEGRGERLDVAAALDALASSADPALPRVLIGWSFGADMALATIDSRVAAWCAIAPPLRFASDIDAVGVDPRPKHLVLAERDEYRSPDSVIDATRAWKATTVEVVPGASHFFVGRSDRVVAAAVGFIDLVSVGA